MKRLSTFVLLFALLFLACTSIPSAAQPGTTQHTLLKGNIVTPDGTVIHGWLDIYMGYIYHLTAQKPDLPGALVVETNDLIFPGFIDLHDHPAFNVFPRWKPPMKYPNRYAWRNSEQFNLSLGEKATALFADGKSFCDIDEYAEVKALIGGTTSMTGFQYVNHPGPLPDCIEGLVRNLDAATGFYGPGQGHERVVNSVGMLPFDMNSDAAARVAEGIRSGAIDLLAIHIAEGRADDAESAEELDLLDSHGLLGPHTTLIHAVGLSPAQLTRVHNAGASIVWSPRSNFELYGTTANLDAAFRAGVTISIAPDWSPTGSDNMWDEIRYAHKVSAESFNDLFTSRQLVEMASSVPARVARIDDKVGTIAENKLADLFLVHTPDTAHFNPYDAITGGSITQIDLVMINGSAVYGTPELLKQFTPHTEPLTVCGTQKALNLDALPNGSFLAVQKRLAARLKSLNTELSPLTECE